MKRRDLLKALTTVPAIGWGLAGATAQAASPADTPSVAKLQADWKMLLADNADVVLSKEPLKLSEQEWSKRLDRMQFYVLRKEGTEQSFTSPLNDEKRPGVFVCRGCSLPVFTSAMKYDSGTGWPSFFTTIPGVFATKTDYKIIFPRTEYHCVRCGGHHGHVFDDGPPPTGKRWCNNGVALRFIPKTATG